MKYLAIVLLSLTMFAATRTPAGEGTAAAPAAAAISFVGVQAATDSGPGAVPDQSPAIDGTLAALVATALVALQLRRRQRSMSAPRALR